MKKDWLVTDFTIDPDLCEVRYSCDSIVREDGDTDHDMTCADFVFDGEFNSPSQPTDGMLSITVDSPKYENDNFPPGTYLITIRGTAFRAIDLRSDTVVFKLILTDVCDPPNSITAKAIGDVVYTVTTDYADFTHAEWDISPSYCPFTYQYTYTYLDAPTNSLTAITNAAKTFSVNYEDEIVPITKV